MRSDRRRILYLSHIDWAWIKQRPQFIAEGLAESFDVEVAYRRLWRRGNLVCDDSELVTHPIWRLPFRRFAISAAISREFERRRIAGLVARQRPDIVWLSYPSFLECLPDGLRRTLPIIYDCMDEATAFAFPHERQRVADCELALLHEAALVLCSSARLADDLLARGVSDSRLRIVRNAFAGAILPPARPQTHAGEHDRLRAGYAGTIARWLDLSALMAALDALPELEIHLVGPVEPDVELPRHPRLVHHRPVPHREVAELARTWDVLLLPFVRDSLIERVDPVKLYEYVNLDRPIIAIEYPEIRRFAAFVDFYSLPAELIERLRSHLDRPARRYTPDERVRFLSQNGWATRSREIEDAIELLYIGKKGGPVSTDRGPAGNS